MSDAPERDRHVVMRFPLPVTWETVRKAVGAIYDSLPSNHPDGPRDGYDVVTGELRLEHTLGDGRDWLDVTFGPYTDAP